LLYYLKNTMIKRLYFGILSFFESITSIPEMIQGANNLEMKLDYIVEKIDELSQKIDGMEENLDEPENYPFKGMLEVPESSLLPIPSSNNYSFLVFPGNPEDYDDFFKVKKS